MAEHAGGCSKVSVSVGAGVAAEVMVMVAAVANDPLGVLYLPVVW